VTEASRFDHRLELAATLLLALAAVTTAWSTYQSSRWHGRQAVAQGASIAARFAATRSAAVANRQVQVDVTTFTQWLDAYGGGNTELADFYRQRFRSEFAPAFDAWVAEKPRTNPEAPATPFAMPQYRLAASAEADRLDAKSDAYGLAVKTYIQRADNYVLAVVLCAAALFFAGISTRLHSLGPRVAILGLGWVLFLGTVVWLATFPVTVAV
jgi:hypothetical protein